MNKEEMFSRITENGFDFLSKARSELEKQPKYSVIHFHAAVELFLKARLLHEHWSLVFAKRQEPDWKKFVAGEFRSVSLDEAAERLRNIVRDGLSDSELEEFKEIAKHRNKMVHFFHQAPTDKENDKLQSIIVKQQLKAWYRLHRLLTDQWEEIFSKWSKKISDIDASLRELREFLQVVFDNLREEICNFRSEGFMFEQCPSCGFKAQKHEGKTERFYESKCLVCGLIEICFKINCPRCGETAIFRDEGFATCQSCNKLLEPENVKEVLINSDITHITPMTSDGLYNIGNCSDCDGYHTVIQTENDEWICVSCFETFESLESCEWCNDLNTGNMEDSYVAGCNHCDGMVKYHSDD